MIAQESPCGGTPHVDSTAVRNKQVCINPFKGPPDALYREAEVTGEKYRCVAAGSTDLDQARLARKREYPQQSLQNIGRQKVQTLHDGVPAGFLATYSAKLPSRLKWTDTIDRPASVSLSERFEAGCVIC